MKTLRMSRAGLAAVSVVLGGCASAPAQRGSSNTERLCIDRRDINTIRALDDHHVLVKVGAGRFFLLTVERTCAELRLARSIGIVEATSRVCGDGHSLISFADPTVGTMRCRIEVIDSVADQNAAMDLIESRREP
jgi:hypothetical protein